jgi:hypothetical protein
VSIQITGGIAAEIMDTIGAQKNALNSDIFLFRVIQFYLMASCLILSFADGV